MIKAVLFDIDGTLLNTGDYIISAYRQVIDKYKIRPYSDKELYGYIGMPLVDIYKEMKPDGDIDAMVKTHNAFQEEHIDLIKPYKHITEVLQKLKENQIRIAAVTNRSNVNAKKSLQLYQLDQFIDSIYSPEDVNFPKPHPESLEKALAEFAVQPEQAMMVGDTEYDIEAGKRANVITVGVTYGYRGEEIRRENPDYVVSDLREILIIIDTKK